MPVALPSQNAAVLYGPRDLRIEERTLWPPHHNQAQVAIVSTGLCGSDCEFKFILRRSLAQPDVQCTITSAVRMETLLFKLLSSLVTKQRVSSPQSELGSSTSFQVSALPSRQASCATTAITAQMVVTTSVKACASVAAPKRFLISMVPSKTV
jgi:hypothetical protein